MQNVSFQNKQLCLLWTLSRTAQHLLSFQNPWNYRVHQRHCLNYTDIPFSSKYLWDHNNYVEYNFSYTQTQIPKTKGNIKKANCSCSPFRYYFLGCLATLSVRHFDTSHCLRLRLGNEQHTAAILQYWKRAAVLLSMLVRDVQNGYRFIYMMNSFGKKALYTTDSETT